MMIRFAILLTSVTIIAFAVPAAASQCALSTAITAVRTHYWAAVRSRSTGPRTMKPHAPTRLRSVSNGRQAAAAPAVDITALDSVINARDLLATKCGG